MTAACGTNRAYIYGCHCRLCRQAHNHYLRAYRRRWRNGQRRTVPAETTAALIRWLRDEGATDVWTAAQLGCDPSRVGQLRRTVHPRVQVATHRRVQRLMEAVAGGALTPPGPRREPDREHGTDAGYRRHVRAGEEPCGDCRAGHAREAADRRAHREAA